MQYIYIYCVVAATMEYRITWRWGEMGPHSITVLRSLHPLPVECWNEDCDDVERKRERVGGTMMYSPTLVPVKGQRSLTPTAGKSPCADLYLAV